MDNFKEKYIITFIKDGKWYSTILDSKWTWNGSLDKPTIRQSILFKYGDETIHIFVTDGKVEECSDSIKGLQLHIFEKES